MQAKEDTKKYETDKVKRLAKNNPLAINPQLPRSIKALVVS